MQYINGDHVDVYTFITDCGISLVVCNSNVVFSSASPYSSVYCHMLQLASVSKLHGNYLCEEHTHLPYKECQ